MDTTDQELDEFLPHSPKQEMAILSDSKITLALTGIQFGKTTIGSMWMKRQMWMHTHKDDAFIITAPNYKIMQQSTLPSFLKRMEGCGDYRIADAEFHLYDGGTCYMRTSTEPDSIVGITNVRAVWGDEAGKYSLYFWENMQARASFRDCPIMLTTTPYTSNWIFKDLVKKTRDKKRDDVLLIEASSNENPMFPKEEFERRRRIMDPRRFAALYLGQFEKMHGLVYDCFSEDAHVVAPFQLPTGTKYYGGIDWGTTNPFSLLIRAITPTGYHYQVSEVYKTGLTISDMIAVAKQKKQIYGIQLFYADPSQPGYIQEFNRHGLSCIGADNDIRRGLDLHIELIKSGKFYVFDGSSPHTIDEISAYHYPEPEDLDPDQDSKEQLPVAQDNHCVPGWTLISTINGLKEIKNIIPGDLVLTRFGYRSVIKKHFNGLRELIKVGNLYCTPDHLVYTYDKGFIRADAISYGDVICCQKNLYLTVLSIVDTLIQSMKAFANTSLELINIKNHLIYTERSGHTLMVQYLMATTYTIKTAILSIMTYPILRLLGLARTFLIILENGTGKIKILRSIILKRLTQWQKPGISLKMDEDGIQNTPRRRNDGIKEAAMSAVLNMSTHYSPQSIVAVNAKPQPLGLEEVYDLDIDGDHEYFANGTLIHNCMDAMRYLTMMTYHSTTRRAPMVAQEVKDITQMDHEKRIDFLKRRNKRDKGSENWR